MDGWARAAAGVGWRSREAGEAAWRTLIVNARLAYDDEEEEEVGPEQGTQILVYHQHALETEALATRIAE